MKIYDTKLPRPVNISSMLKLTYCICGNELSCFRMIHLFPLSTTIDQYAYAVFQEVITKIEMEGYYISASFAKV